MSSITLKAEIPGSLPDNEIRELFSRNVRDKHGSQLLLASGQRGSELRKFVLGWFDK